MVKKYLMICISVAVVCASFLSCVWDKKNNVRKVDDFGDKLVAVNKKYDFGVAKDSDSVNYNFKISNISLETIQINKAKVTCGCLVIKDYPKEIAPDAIAEVNGSIGLKGKKGKFNKVVYLVYGNGDILLLRIVGIVQ